MVQLRFDPKNDIPDLSGKVILITGGTAGIGRSAVLELFEHNPAHVLFTGRNAEAARSIVVQAPEHIKATFIPCDMTRNESVLSAAQQILTIIPDRLDVLVCCAGIMAKPPAVTADGYEIQFATNQLSHSFLIRKLLPLLEKTSALPDTDTRIIMVTSLGWKGARSGGIDFEKLESKQDMPVLGPWFRYGQSKLANMLYARELAKRYPHITSVSIHPGVIKTGLVTDLTWSQRMLVYATNIGQILTIEQGAYNLLWAITTDQKNFKNGGFYLPVGELSTDTTTASETPGLSERLWEWTEAQLAKHDKMT